jgi:hypothetical protein
VSRREGWLDLDTAAIVEVTSEEKEYGIESARVCQEAQGLALACLHLPRLACGGRLALRIDSEDE